jgi:hypothetical protein
LAKSDPFLLAGSHERDGEAGVEERRLFVGRLARNGE